MLLLAASLAHAGLRGDLQDALAAGPDAVVACSSGGEAMDRVGALLQGMPDPPEEETFAQLTALLAGDQPAALSWWKADNVMEIRFAAPDGLDGVRTRMAGAGFEVGADGQVLEDGEPQGTLEVRDGRAAFRSDPLPTALPHELPAAFVAHLPETAGCVIYAHVPLEATGPLDIGLHLPFGKGEPGTWSMAVPKLAGAQAVELDGATPPTVATAEAPQAVLTVGFGLDDVDFANFLEGKELRQARRFQRLFPLTGGTTVAFFGGGASPTVAAVLPFSRPLSGRTILRRVWAGLKDAEQVEAERLDATHLRVRFKETDLFLTADTGRLWLATQPGTLNALQAGVGTPWIGPELVGLAEQWPLLVAASGSPLPASGLPPLSRPLFVTLDIDGGVAFGLVDLPIPAADLMRLGDMARKARLPKPPPAETY